MQYSLLLLRKVTDGMTLTPHAGVSTAQIVHILESYNLDAIDMGNAVHSNTTRQQLRKIRLLYKRLCGELSAVCTVKPVVESEYRTYRVPENLFESLIGN